MIRKRQSIIQNYQKAVRWIVYHSPPGQGVIHSSELKISYPEVSGYLIPTLINAGDKELALTYADYLLSCQNADGSFSGLDGKKYIFDTAQALRGLVTVAAINKKYLSAAKRAGRYIAKKINTGNPPDEYDGNIPMQINLYSLFPLRQLGVLTKNKKIVDIARRSLNHYKRQGNLLAWKSLTHYYAYIIDGLIEMGNKDMVKPYVVEIFKRQKLNGAIPALPNESWTCLPGIAQFSLIGYKLGFKKEADRALGYLCRIQSESGGFLGSAGEGAEYLRDSEVSWANKFFLDAVHLKMKGELGSFANVQEYLSPKKNLSHIKKCKLSPKVSVILPTYNRPDYLDRAIKNILEQTYKNLELIIVDDGSSNQTKKVVKKYADQGIQYKKNAHNKGLPYSLNEGFKSASGEYLTWTSDDNLYKPTAIEEMVSEITTRKKDFVFADYFLCDDSFIVKKEYNLSNQPARDLKKINCIGFCFLFNRKVYEKIGEYNTEYELVEDYDYWIRVSQQFEMDHINKTLYYASLSPNSMTEKRIVEIIISDLLLKYNHSFLSKNQCVKRLCKFLVKEEKKANPSKTFWLSRKWKLSGQIKKIISVLERNDFHLSKTSKEIFALVDDKLKH